MFNVTLRETIVAGPQTNRYEEENLPLKWRRKHRSTNRRHHILIATILTVIKMAVNCNAFLMDARTARLFEHDSAISLISADDFDDTPSALTLNGASLFNDKSLGNLEQSIAAVFSKVAYGTTTKRSIPDTFVPTLTTIATPPLTTFRYRDKDGFLNYPSGDSSPAKSLEPVNRGYEYDLERDHGLPTSAPNADILKSNSNPTYPNPNRHHHVGHRHNNSTPSSVHNLKKQFPTPTYSGDMPAYSPPSRSLFTPPLPPGSQYSFADKPTLRGTNSDIGSPPSGSFINRRPIPPPSLMPGHERIPYRPGDINGTVSNPGTGRPVNGDDYQRKKQLNTPSTGRGGHKSDRSGPETDGNVSDSAVLHFPSISRILSGSNGRKEDIPAVLLRTVTSRPSQQPMTIEEPIETTSGDDRRYPDDLADFDPYDEPIVQSKLKPVQTQPPPQLEPDQSTEIIGKLPALHNDDDRHLTVDKQPTIGTTEREAVGGEMSGMKSIATWTIAWNVHVYSAAILFTVLAVYSIFKIIFFDKLTHLFTQNYFICIHLILIVICLLRIFFLCYDAYNMHSSFPPFVAEMLLNLPATFLTISFAALILFLLLRSVNGKTNRYAALMRPFTVLVGSVVHVGLCVTLHYVESYTQTVTHAKLYSRGTGHPVTGPPRVLSLICQIIYIFVCLCLGGVYLYLYRVLKRILRTKAQNYIHGYQNLSYAIHITIATALLYILMAAVQVYGAISISTTRPITMTASDIDWFQCGYQFSLRLIEIAIITLIAWVTGLKTGAPKPMGREKTMETHNVSGFALFPCTSSSSQEHFETDYPAVCNANTNLHAYAMRTGKPIYDDTFAMNSIEGGGGGMGVGIAPPAQRIVPIGEYQMSTDYGRQLDGISRGSGGDRVVMVGDTVEYLTEPADHYENPNFELKRTGDPGLETCYAEPCQQTDSGICSDGFVDGSTSSATGRPGYDFQNFERPTFDRSAGEFRASKNLKALKSAGMLVDRGQYEERRSGRLNNSFDRRAIRTMKTGGGPIGVVPTHIRSGRSSGVQTMVTGERFTGRGVGPRTGRGTTRGSMERSSTTHLVSGGLITEDIHVRQSDQASVASSSDTSRTSAQTTPCADPIDRKPTPYIGSSLDTQSSFEAQHSSSGDSANSNSMLVAEHGFVRFRALDDIGIMRHSYGQPGKQVTAGTTTPTQQTIGASFRARTNKERSYTNS